MAQNPPGGRAAVLAGGAVALVAVLALVLVQVLGAGTGGGTGGGTAPGRDTAGGPPSSSVAPPTDGGCVEPPAPPVGARQYDRVPDAALAEDARWRARIATTCGEIVVELLGDRAPQTVASFLFLAREGYWVDSPCHRLVPEGIFVLQCGDPTGTGTGGPGYGYGVENAPDDGVYPRGTLAMARTADPNSNGGQFFVVYRRTLLPDPTGYSVFGRVVSGMDVVDRVAEAGTGGTLGPEAPAQPISILGVTVERA